MGQPEHVVEIRTGRRGADGRVRLSVFTSDMLALAIEGHGERAPTMLLTLEQARELQRALSEMIPLLTERKEAGDDVSPAVWQGAERRTTGQLNK